MRSDGRSISRDEAREVAVIALVSVVGLRLVAGVVQVLQELQVPWNARALLTQFLQPIDTNVGMVMLGAVLLVVLSPAGSVSPGVWRLCDRGTAVVFGLALASTLSTLSLSLGVSFLSRLRFALYNGLGAVVLGGAAWWIIRSFDPDR